MLVSPDDAALHRRITGEFHEMPGLTLTLPQAARLFSLEISRCEQVLEDLVDEGQLATMDGSFASPGRERRHR